MSEQRKRKCLVAERPHPGRKSSVNENAQRTENILVLLSQSCDRHREYHEGADNNTEELPTQPSETCQNDLRAVEKILPKVEEMYDASQRPRAEDLGHICDFYTHVLRGIFCRHAPTLFCTPAGSQEDGTRVLPRIRLLMGNLATKRFMNAASRDEAVMVKLCATLGDLLQLLPTSVTDLANLLLDLAVVQEAGLVNAGATIHIWKDVKWTVSSLELLHFLQASTLMILIKVLASNRRTYLDPEQPLIRMSSIDNWWSGDGDGLVSVLGGLRPLLLRPLSRTSSKAKTMDFRSKIESYKFLKLMVEDWHRTGSVVVAVLLDVTGLACRSLVFGLESLNDAGQKFETEAECLCQSIVALLQLLVIQPPVMGGANEVRQVAVPPLLDCVRRMGLLDIFASVRVAILQAIKVCLMDSADTKQISLNYATSEGIVATLFDLLKEPSLNRYVVDILLELECCTGLGLIESISSVAEQTAEHPVPIRPQPEPTNAKPTTPAPPTQPKVTPRAKRKRASPKKAMHPSPLQVKSTPTKKPHPSLGGSEVALSPSMKVKESGRAVTKSWSFFECLADTTRYAQKTAARFTGKAASLPLEELGDSTIEITHLVATFRLLSCSTKVPTVPNDIVRAIAMLGKRLSNGNGHTLYPHLVEDLLRSGLTAHWVVHHIHRKQELIKEALDSISHLAGIVAFSDDERDNDCVTEKQSGVGLNSFLSGLPLHKGFSSIPNDYSWSKYRCVNRALRRFDGEGLALLLVASCQGCHFKQLLRSPDRNAVRLLPLTILSEALTSTTSNEQATSWLMHRLQRFPLQTILEEIGSTSRPCHHEALLSSLIGMRRLWYACCDEMVGDVIDRGSFFEILEICGLSFTEGALGMTNVEQFHPVANISKEELRMADQQARAQIVSGLLGVNVQGNALALKWKLISESIKGLENDGFHGLPVRVDEGCRENTVSWLLHAVFADKCPPFKLAASRQIGKTLLTNHAALLCKIFASQDEDAILRTETNDLSELINSVKKKQVENDVMARVFLEIDRLLFRFCFVSQSQLSFTMAHSTHDASATSASIRPEERDDHGHVAVVSQRAAQRVLASICRNVDTNTSFGLLLFEYAFVRLVRFWTSIDKWDNGELQATSAALSFCEILRMDSSSPLGQILSGRCLETFTPALFNDLLLPSLNCFVSGDPHTLFVRDRQFQLLLGFIGTFLSNEGTRNTIGNLRTEMPPLRWAAGLVREFVERALPHVVTALIIEKEHDMLKLTTAFRLFSMDAKRIVDKRARPTQVGDCINIRTPHRKTKSRVPQQTELDNQTQLLCLSPHYVERIVSRLLMDTTDRSQHMFFLQEVLKKKWSLKALIENRSNAVLKTLIWELGSDDNMGQRAIHAIRAAAIAREIPTGGTPTDRTTLNQPGAPASRWITQHFMFLMFNVVQCNWKLRETSDRVRALRCLKIMLRLLDPDKASQFLSPILATVIMATSQNINGPDSLDVARLHLLTIQCLSSFVKLFADLQTDVVGNNLTTIVVSLFPFVVWAPGVDSIRTKEVFLRAETKKQSVNLLEYLSRGELGKSLANYFKHIPFLPNVQALEGVREALRSNGVNFDDLLVMSSTSGSQAVPMSTLGSPSSSGTPTKSKDGGVLLRHQAALQRRLAMLYQLLDHESAAVRNVVLEYLCDLVRANRGLLCSVVRKEDEMRSKRVLTVVSPNGSSSFDVRSGVPRGTVARLVNGLLSRCSVEEDVRSLELLGKCLGEIGAIDVHRLGHIRKDAAQKNDCALVGDDGRSWQMGQPPWHSSRPRYELQLVTKQLVSALRAAPTSRDQNKVAFCIQQMLDQLNSSANLNLDATKKSRLSITNETHEKEPISQWLRGKLVQAEVIDVVEPYWSSEYKEVDCGRNPRPPPFYRHATTYFSWLSSWCRYMIWRAKRTVKSHWSPLFHACRTAIRSPSGIRIAEFLLPLLILDRLCFGTLDDSVAVLTEIQDVLSPNDHPTGMELGDRQRSLNTMFDVFDIFQRWSEREIEDRFKSSRSTKAAAKKGFGYGDDPQRGDENECTWSVDTSLDKIGEVLERIPLDMRARAASAVGMHARALQCFEMFGRLNTVEAVFNDPLNQTTKSDAGRTQPVDRLTGVDTCSLKEVLGKLNDFDTMEGMPKNANVVIAAEEDVVEKEARGDWADALHDYERALQLASPVAEAEASKRFLEHGTLRCLLELGQYESVMNQALGMTRRHAMASRGEDASAATAFAVSASWRLGRWSELEKLLKEASDNPTSMLHADNANHFNIGRAMLGLRCGDANIVSRSISDARTSVVGNLSNLSRESYTRCYSSLVQLQALREIEDASTVICARNLGAKGDLTRTFAEHVDAEEFGGWAWERRAELMSTVSSSTVMDVRVALAHLSADTSLAGRLLLSIGSKSRKIGLNQISANALVKAASTLDKATFNHSDDTKRSEAADFVSSVQMELAHLAYDAQEHSAALTLLGDVDVSRFGNMEQNEVLKAAIQEEKRFVRSICGLETGEAGGAERFTKRFVTSTRWMGESGLKEVREIFDRYRVAIALAPDSEEAHFGFGKYLDSLLDARTAASVSSSNDPLHKNDPGRTFRIGTDKSCQNYLSMALNHYVEALTIGSTFVDRALPRALSLWFEISLISVQQDAEHDLSSGSKRKSGGKARRVTEIQSSLENTQDACNETFAQNMKKIPARSLYTALPQLISRVCIHNKDTASVVEYILARILTKFPGQAMWRLAWLRQAKQPKRQCVGKSIFKKAESSLLQRGDTHGQRLLAESERLITFLTKLAKHHPKDPDTRHMTISPWKGTVNLCEYVPPVQAALSVPQESTSSHSHRDVLPKMRSFCSKVTVMHSKAKPKRLKVFCIPSNRRATPTMGISQSTGASAKTALPGDIGELHFLVKHETQGDLRKDARVQDFNSVINRLFSNSDAHGRRLHLRTFAVTCVSEDCAILEWVPDTMSLRLMISNSYNPQASPFAKTRRGKRITSFTDLSLRQNYEKVQNTYFKGGKLIKAARLFEELCLKPHPPVFFWWFVQNFVDPHSWYEARNRFAQCAAAWSAVGHVIGLGDRHAENILIDTNSGDCVHVDFDCIFDKGLALPKPEVIPFRLTANMVDAMGPVGCNGVFLASMKFAMRTLRDNRDTLLSVLEPFINDPIIDWKKSRSQQARTAISTEAASQQAKRKVKIIEERLKGIFNLDNPNRRKVRRVDETTSSQDDAMGRMLPLSVEGQVEKLISEATSSENLLQLYVGWMPWV